MTLVDSNVLLDLSADGVWADWSIEQLAKAAAHGLLLINPIIYAELAPRFDTQEQLREFIAGVGLVMVEITTPALFLAGQAHRRYRRNGGERKRMLADFLIGAQAQVTERPILTRDPQAYRTYFPDVRLITP